MDKKLGFFLSKGWKIYYGRILVKEAIILVVLYNRINNKKNWLRYKDIGFKTYQSIIIFIGILRITINKLYKNVISFYNQILQIE